MVCRTCSPILISLSFSADSPKQDLWFILVPSWRDLAEANQLLSPQEEFAGIRDLVHPIEHWLDDLLDEVAVGHDAQVADVRLDRLPQSAKTDCNSGQQP